MQEWLYEIIHRLATHYGWSKREILEEVYPDEVHYYLQHIQRDDVHERLMQLSVAHNPHSKDPNHLVSVLNQQLEQREDKGYLYQERMSRDDEQALKELVHCFRLRKGGSE